jgi:glycosyltransferase involved in cell wall biosynthesis
MDSLENIKLNLAGNFNDKNFEYKVKSYASWKKVNELGFLSREKILDVYRNSKVGLVTLHPITNYLDALPVKMFEYMAAGIPLISSDIKLWKDIVEDNNCGICVNPLDSIEISKGINYLLTHPEYAQLLGKNGRMAIEEKYNWNIEVEKLYMVYEELINE